MLPEDQMHSRLKHPRGGEVNLHDLFVIVLLAVALVAGVVTGVRLTSDFGTAAQVLGALVGPVIAIVAVCTLLLLYAIIILGPLERFCRWWRPHPPPCENGTCSHKTGYTPYKLPDHVVRRWKGLSRSAYQCQCGHAYGGGYESPLRGRWVRVLPDGALRPYLRYRPFGRWKPDDPDSIVAVPRVPPRPEIQLPGWTLPVLMFAICGGMAFVVAFRDIGESSQAWPFVIGCAALGLVLGIVCEFSMRGSRK